MQFTTRRALIAQTVLAIGAVSRRRPGRSAGLSRTSRSA
jgi:hypothetical protein